MNGAPVLSALDPDLGELLGDVRFEVGHRPSLRLLHVQLVEMSRFEWPV